LGIHGVTRYGAFRGEAIPGGKTLIEDMPLSLQQDVTYEETKEYLEKVIMMKYTYITPIKSLLEHISKHR